MSPNRLRPRVHMTLSQECIDRIDAIAALSGESRSACVERVFMRGHHRRDDGQDCRQYPRPLGDAVKRLGKKETK